MAGTPSEHDIQQAIDEFWALSTAFYESPMVSEYLLELQNSQKKNINELLFALWISHSQHVAISHDNVERISWAAERSKKWVENIRETRFELQQQWQPPYPEKIRSARDAMLETELKIERLQQQKLVEAFFEEKQKGAMSEMPDEESCMMLNLMQCCGEPANEADYLQLIMLWQGFMESQMTH